MDNKLKVEFTRDDLIKICYWIVLKYREDNYHQQNAGSRRDLLGGFFDRWINRAPESLIFKQLLKDKTYDVVNDYFIYDSKSDKNSPDVLGLVDSNGDVVRFSYYDNGTWVHVEDMPFIEMKTFREDQNLITIPESQFDENHYYVIVESHVAEDYLISLFIDDFFQEEVFNSLKIDESFIESDINNNLLFPKKIDKLNSLGYFKLLGIYKGSDLLPFAKKISFGTKPRYMKNISKAYYNKSNYDEELTTGIYTPDIEDVFIPISIQLKDYSKLVLKNNYKSYSGVQVKGGVNINGVNLTDGYFRINYSQFDKKSEVTELFLTKGAVSLLGKDSTNNLLSIFEKLIANIDNDK